MTWLKVDASVANQGDTTYNRRATIEVVVNGVRRRGAQCHAVDIPSQEQATGSQ